MRVRRNDVEQWMSHRLLPENPRERVRRYEHYTWQETRGVDEHSLLHNLPRDIQRHYKRHLCLALLMQVSILFVLIFVLLVTENDGSSIHAYYTQIDNVYAHM